MSLYEKVSLFLLSVVNMSDAHEEVELWKKCTELQSQMIKALKANNDPFAEEIENIRFKFVVCVYSPICLSKE